MCQCVTLKINLFYLIKSSTVSLSRVCSFGVFVQKYLFVSSKSMIIERFACFTVFGQEVKQHRFTLSSQEKKQRRKFETGLTALQ